MEHWKIQRERTKCTQPGCPLPTATEFFAVLELPSCLRRDLCATCFHNLDTDHDPIFWRARRKRNGKRETTLDLASLRLLFDRLGQESCEQAQGLRYFVALLLLRKRLLKMVDPTNEAEESADLLVIDPKNKTMAPIALTAPELDPERLGGLKDELLAAVAAGDRGESGDSP